MPTIMLVLLLLVPTALAVGPEAVSNPRSRSHFVADTASVLDEAAEAALESRIAALHRELGVEIALVTVPDVDRDPKDFATDLFKLWGVGSAKADNGLLVLMVVGQRRLEMETGYGLEPVLPDAWLGAMQRRVMVPEFKEGRFGEGLVAGLGEIDTRIRSRPEDSREGTRRAGATVRGRRPERRAPGGSPFVVLGAIVLAGGGVFGVQVWRRKKERTCPKCSKEMRLLTEEEEDVHLDDGQEKEEEIGSVHYDVRICESCEFVRVIPHRSMWTSYQRCPACRYRTGVQRSSTLVQATEYSGGLVEVRETCVRCDHKATRRMRTPRRARVVVHGGPGGFGGGGGGFGGGGGGGGSFGGGRSGGGGAGSSW